MRTDDGGAHWVEQLVDSSHSGTRFNDIQFLIYTNGWATGLHILYQTDNGGQTWSKIPDSLFIPENAGFPTGLGDMQSVYFTDEERGMASGTLGLIASTKDGGQTWRSSIIAPEQGYIDTLHYVVMVNADTACGVGLGGIAMSTDGGESWRVRHSEFRNYKKCVFVNGLVGWTLSLDAQILRTENAGEDWQDLGQIYQDYLVAAADMDFVDELTGWVITSLGTIWGTEDGGFSWNVDTVSSNHSLTSVDFVSKEIGLATDREGGLFRARRSKIVGVKHASSSPGTLSLLPNYPNPFNPETTLRYQTPGQQRITLEIFNLVGRKVITLVDEIKAVGEHSVLWNGRDETGNPMASGVYFAKLASFKAIHVQKMLLIR